MYDGCFQLMLFSPYVALLAQHGLAGHALYKVPPDGFDMMVQLLMVHAPDRVRCVDFQGCGLPSIRCLGLLLCLLCPHSTSAC